MFDERAFFSRLESADVDAFATLLEHPSHDEERALRVYFGDARYKSMHSLARRRWNRIGGEPAGNVVVIHGILGSILTGEDREGTALQLWPNMAAITSGQLPRLRLAENGIDEAAPGDYVGATGIVKRYYGEMLLTLAESWNVHAFSYDWRKNLDIAADKLYAQLSDWFEEGAHVHLVAHGMGGLVARTFIEKHRERWSSMGGRLVMLSTPNHGSFEVIRTLFGLGTTRILAKLDSVNSGSDLARVFASFVSPWQLLPSMLEREGIEPLYDPATYGNVLGVSATRIAIGAKHHERLRDVIDVDRMVCINGSNRPTIDGITTFSNLSDPGSYRATWDGDGWVPTSMSRLTLRREDSTPDDSQVPIFYVEDDHGGLPSNRSILAALDDVLRAGRSDRLHTLHHVASAEERGPAIDVLNTMKVEESQFTEYLRSSPGRLGAAGASRSSRDLGSAGAAWFSSDERRIEELVTRGVLSARQQRTSPGRPTRIEIRIVAGRIEDFDDQLKASNDFKPVDVISVGLYLGSRPLIETRALDRAISAARFEQPTGGEPPIVRETDLLIAQFAERGTIRAELGHCFIFEDPRSRNSGEHSARLIAIVGMGLPGRFGEPELALVSRELCWTLGQLGKTHMATSLIGIGRGNLNPQDATLAFLRGIKHAVTGTSEDLRRALTRVTFVESNPANIRAMQKTVAAEKDRLARQDRLIIDFEPSFTEKQLKAAEEHYRRRERAERDSESAFVSRITVTMQKGERTYRFGAITEHAAIPEREIVIDPHLVDQANKALPATRDLESQLEEGQVLEKLLLPAELRGQIYSSAPLVLMLDSSMARIHWEMIVQSDHQLLDPDEGQSMRGDGAIGFDARRFLGTSRGVTRQLQTTFSQPPEPTPPPRRTMRVLIIADPAEDSHLPGAEDEGLAVARLFEQFNIVYEQSDNRVEVVTLLGPHEATRNNVMKALLLRSFDVLHFAGHITYVENKPERSGWVFTDKHLITASELNRIDRIPNFIFSNACESGVTPNRSEERTVELGPTFAEAFFQRGVKNFVCTAWPVDDLIARDFAVKLYEQLLGLDPIDKGAVPRYRAVEPMQMHKAMRDARRHVASRPLGVRSWGAYQHYGNPYMRFFDPFKMRSTGN